MPFFELKDQRYKKKSLLDSGCVCPACWANKKTRPQRAGFLNIMACFADRTCVSNSFFPPPDRHYTHDSRPQEPYCPGDRDGIKSNPSAEIGNFCCIVEVR